MISRSNASILVVVFVLVTVWASYNLSSQLTAAPVTSPSSTPALTYDALGSYYYVADLAPNHLTNSTSVTGTNGTLFTSITRWINVTFLDGVTLSPATEVRLADRFVVTLSTPDWSKPLVETAQQNASSNTSGLTVTDQYDLNVSWVENLTQSIDAQLDYYPSQFEVTLAPVVAGTITLSSGEAPLLMRPFLNLTFTESYLGSLITAVGSSALQRGQIDGPAVSSDGTDGSALDYAYLFLAASLGALSVSLALFFSTRKGTKPEKLPDLDTLIEPYEEVIARTTREPRASTMLPVERWEDLVKVADTLGRPILRPVGRPTGAAGSSFYVVDGSVAYEYRYPSSRHAEETRPVPTVQPSEQNPGSRGGSKAVGVAKVVPPERSRVPPKNAGAAGVDVARLAAEQLRADMERIRSSQLSPSERTRAVVLLRRAMRVVRSASPEEIPQVLEEFHSTLDELLGESSPSR